MSESPHRAFRTAVFLSSLVAACGPAFSQPPLVPASSFYTITLCRLYDSRAADGAFEPGEQREIQVATACGIPAGAVAVAANLTAVSPSATGNFLLFPNSLLPTTSNALSFKAGITVAGSGIYPLSDNGLGTVSVLAPLTSGRVDLLVDVAGYFLPAAAVPPDAPPVCPTATTGVKAVDCWEGRVSLNGSAGTFKPLDAYRRAKVRIDLKQNGEPRGSLYAYWNGGLSFAFRTAFPFQGTWSWTAVCEECLGRSLVAPAGGTVTVGRRRTSPLLYSRGGLSVHPSGRFLQHQTGSRGRGGVFHRGEIRPWIAGMRPRQAVS